MKSLPPISQQRWGRTIQSMAPGTLGGTLLSARPYLPKAPYSFEEPAGYTAFAWYRAEDVTGLSDGETMDTWPDHSGNGYDLTGGEGNTYQDMSGTPAIRLGDAAFQTYADHEFSPVVPMDSVHVFAVISDSTDTTDQIIKDFAWLFNGDAFLLRFGIDEIEGGNPTLIFDDATAATTETVIAASAVSPRGTERHLWECYRSPGDSKLYLDGAQVCSTSVDLGTVDLQYLWLGERCKEQFYEVVVLDRKADATERAFWNGYLTDKFGL